MIMRFAVSGSVSGEFELFSLGGDGSFLQWPSIFQSDWRGAAIDAKARKRSAATSTAEAVPINVSRTH